ncbi:MAG: M23 family metallopeptidase [Oscillospiraceae bacterium]|nr:M23 family metallopeptidase [Oscillospiraceae bacterium]
MLVEKEKKRLKLPKGQGFYLALALTVVAAGIGVWGAVSSSINNAKFTPLIPGTSTAQTAIDWNNIVTRPIAPDPPEEPANVPVTGVKDDRETTTKARTDNIPYTGTFALPFGSKISKDYSGGEMVKSATMGDWRVHNGVDFLGEVNDAVFAIQDGSVAKVMQDPLWGIVVVIDHGNGLTARYCGLSEGSTPHEGQEVKKGEVVGVIAQIPVESAEGVHLHFETYVNNKVADPLGVMNKTGGKAASANVNPNE